MHSSPCVQPLSKKGFRKEHVGFPFPNFLLGEHEVPAICRCVFDGDKFYVLSSKDMHILNHNGSFGVSSLTHRGPSDEEPSFYLKPYFTKKMERESSSAITKGSLFKLVEASELPLGKENLERTQGTSNNWNKSSINNSVNCEVGSSDSFNSKPSPRKCNQRQKMRSSNISNSNGNKSDDVMSEDDNDYDEEEDFVINNGIRQKDLENASEMSSTKRDLLIESLRCNIIEEERLILMPEEVIFLSFGVGCLTIQSPSGGSVGYRKVWRRLVETNPEFPILYAVYHYFRSKNWVPKLGDSYGASYMLYKVGPSAYHASYLVHILGFPSRPSPTWNELSAWVRLGCHTSKNVLLCEVSVPRRFDAVASEPRSIFDMSLKETSLFRWKANSGSLIKF